MSLFPNRETIEARNESIEHLEEQTENYGVDILDAFEAYEHAKKLKDDDLSDNEIELMVENLGNGYDPEHALDEHEIAILDSAASDYEYQFRQENYGKDDLEKMASDILRETNFVAEQRDTRFGRVEKPSEEIAEDVIRESLDIVNAKGAIDSDTLGDMIDQHLKFRYVSGSFYL